MNRTAALLSGSLLLTLAAAVTSCASPKHRGDEAVYCSKCKTVWVESLDMDDPYGLTYVSEPQMQCPDCRSAVASFFKSGRFEHTCATCGDALVHCTQHD